MLSPSLCRRRFRSTNRRTVQIQTAEKVTKEATTAGDESSAERRGWNTEPDGRTEGHHRTVDKRPQRAGNSRSRGHEQGYSKSNDLKKSVSRLFKEDVVNLEKN